MIGRNNRIKSNVFSVALLTLYLGLGFPVRIILSKLQKQSPKNIFLIELVVFLNMSLYVVFSLKIIFDFMKVLKKKILVTGLKKCTACDGWKCTFTCSF